MYHWLNKMIADRIGIYLFISYIENEYPAKPDGQKYIIIIGMGFCQLFTLCILYSFIKENTNKSINLSISPTIACRDCFWKLLSEARLLVKLPAYGGGWLGLSAYVLSGLSATLVYSCCCVGKLACLCIVCGGFLNFWAWDWISLWESCGRDMGIFPSLPILLESPNVWLLADGAFCCTWVANAWLVFIDGSDCWLSK